MLTIVGENIPFLNILYMIFVMAPIMGGFTIFLLNAINDTNPTVGDLFAGFQNYWRWMGTYWLLTAISAACCIPALIAVLIGAAADPYQEGLFFAIMIPGVLVSLVILVAVMLRWMLVYYLVAEGGGVMDSLKRSAQLTEGVRLQLFGVGIVLGLFSMCGLIACLVGVIVTSIISGFAFAAIYRDLKSAMSPAAAAVPVTGTVWAPDTTAAPGTIAPTMPAQPAMPAEPTAPAEPSIPAEPTMPAQPTMPAEPTAPAAPAPPSVQWYVAVGGQQTGPMSQADLAARIQTGQVTTDTLVWRQGLPDWLRAGQLPELASLFSQPPGPAPPSPA